MMEPILAFDSETGGIDTEKTLLTAYYTVLDENLEPIDAIDLKLKPEKDQPYVVTAKALEINHINLLEHDRSAIPFEEGAKQLYEFLSKHSNNGKRKLIPLGHNVDFDIGFSKTLVAPKTWDTHVSYRKLDTSTLAQALKVIQLLPSDNKGSLESLYQHYFGEYVQEHSARQDTLDTVKVFKRQIFEFGQPLAALVRIQEILARLTEESDQEDTETALEQIRQIATLGTL